MRKITATIGKTGAVTETWDRTRILCIEVLTGSMTTAPPAISTAIGTITTRTTGDKLTNEILTGTPIIMAIWVATAGLKALVLPGVATVTAKKTDLDSTPPAVTAAIPYLAMAVRYTALTGIKTALVTATTTAFRKNTGSTVRTKTAICAGTKITATTTAGTRFMIPRRAFTIQCLSKHLSATT